MKELMQKLRESSVKEILDCDSAERLEAMRVRYLGKKGELTAILRQMGSLSAEERPAMGQLANQLRSEIEEAIDKRREELSSAMMELKLERSRRRDAAGQGYTHGAQAPDVQRPRPAQGYIHRHGL